MSTSKKGWISTWSMCPDTWKSQRNERSIVIHGREIKFSQNFRRWKQRLRLALWPLWARFVSFLHFHFISGKGLLCSFISVLSLEKVEAAVTNPVMVTILKSRRMSRAQQILLQRRRLAPANLQTHLLWLMIISPWSWTRFVLHTWNKKDKLTKLTKFLFG